MGTVWKWVSIAALLACALPGAAAQAADDENKIDCAETDFSFPASGYETECKDLSQNSINLETDLAGNKANSIFAFNQDTATFVSAVDDRVASTRVYMRRMGLQEEVSEIYRKMISIDEWKSGEEVSDYETADFTGNFKDGGQLDCIAFRRMLNRRYDGYGRKVIGIACADTRDRAIEALKQLQAPGS